MNTTRILGAGAAALLMPLVLSANPISGSIQFSGSATFNDSATASIGYSDPLGLLSSPIVLAFSQTGDYSGVPTGTVATWSPFTFLPPASSRTPLWNMTVNGLTYTFDATSMTADASNPGVITIQGMGIAHITGFDDTLGIWSVAATSHRGVNFLFNASTTASAESVPDAGATALLLGSGLAALALLRKKLA